MPPVRKRSCAGCLIKEEGRHNSYARNLFLTGETPLHDHLQNYIYIIGGEAQGTERADEGALSLSVGTS